MLEEDEQPAKRNSDYAVHRSTLNTDETNVGRISHSPSQDASVSSSAVVQTDSMTDDASAPASLSTVSSRTTSVDLPNEDPWVPVSGKVDSPVHSPTGSVVLVDGKRLSTSHLQCCNGVVAAAAVPNSAARCDSDNLGSEQCAVSSNKHCQCCERCLQKVPETRSLDVDEVPYSDAGLRHNLTEIKEGVPVNCFDERDRSTGTTHPTCANCVHHRVVRQSDVGHVPTTRAGDSTDISCHSPAPIAGSRPARRASLIGLRKAVRSVMIHRSSPMAEHPENLADSDLCLASFGSSTSGLSDNSGESGSVTEKACRSAGSKRLPKIGRRHYFGGGRRTQRSGGSLAIDSVRQSLTHLLRGGADHRSSVVGERMAAGSLDQPTSSTLSLARPRKHGSRRFLSGDFDCVDAAEVCRTRSELLQTLSGAGEQSESEHDEMDGLTTRTSTCPSDLDTSDSFYESRLFDALEAQEDHGGDGGDGFDTDSSDDGTYSAESFSDLTHSDDQPTSTTSSRRSIDVDAPAGCMEPLQLERVSADVSGDGRQAPGAALHLLHRAASHADLKALGGQTAGSAISSSNALQQRNSLKDSASPQLCWKRLSL